MSQQAVVQVFFAAVRIDQFTVGCFGHGINGQVTAQQVLFQRNAGAGIGLKAGVARAGFTLGTCECVFFLCLRMQEHREILAHRLIAECQHGLCRAADHHPVTFPDGESQQLVTHRTTDQVGFHCGCRCLSGAPRLAAKCRIMAACIFAGQAGRDHGCNRRWRDAE